MRRPTFTVLPGIPDAERGRYIALGMALMDYAEAEESYRGRTPEEERRLGKLFVRITLAAEAVADYERSR